MATINISSSRGGPVVGIVFMLVGIGAAVWGFGEMKNARASSSWPTVGGVIDASEVDWRRETSTSSSGTKRRTTKYTADVRYSYKYEGSSYTSRRLAFGGKTSGSRHIAEETVRRYPKGKKVKVYVNPAKPGTACLEPGASVKSYIPLGVGLLFAVIGLGMAIAGFVGNGSSGDEVAA